MSATRIARPITAAQEGTTAFPSARRAARRQRPAIPPGSPAAIGGMLPTAEGLGGQDRSTGRTSWTAIRLRPSAPSVPANRPHFARSHPARTAPPRRGQRSARRPTRGRGLGPRCRRRDQATSRLCLRSCIARIAVLSFVSVLGALLTSPPPHRLARPRLDPLGPAPCRIARLLQCVVASLLRGG